MPLPVHRVVAVAAGVHVGDREQTPQPFAALLDATRPRRPRRSPPQTAAGRSSAPQSSTTHAGARRPTSRDAPNAQPPTPRRDDGRGRQQLGGIRRERNSGPSAAPNTSGSLCTAHRTRQISAASDRPTTGDSANAATTARRRQADLERNAPQRDWRPQSRPAARVQPRIPTVTRARSGGTASDAAGSPTERPAPPAATLRQPTRGDSQSPAERAPPPSSRAADSDGIPQPTTTTTQAATDSSRRRQSAQRGRRPVRAAASGGIVVNSRPRRRLRPRRLLPRRSSTAAAAADHRSEPRQSASRRKVRVRAGQPGDADQDAAPAQDATQGPTDAQPASRRNCAASGDPTGQAQRVRPPRDAANASRRRKRPTTDLTEPTQAAAGNGTGHASAPTARLPRPLRSAAPASSGPGRDRRSEDGHSRPAEFRLLASAPQRRVSASGDRSRRHRRRPRCRLPGLRSRSRRGRKPAPTSSTSGSIRPSSAASTCSLDVDRDGQVTTHVTADRADTLQLLQSQQPQLERALEQAGLKTADNGLQFTLRDQSFAGQNNGGGNGRSRSGAACHSRCRPAARRPRRRFIRAPASAAGSISAFERMNRRRTRATRLRTSHHRHCPSIGAAARPRRRRPRPRPSSDRASTAPPARSRSPAISIPFCSS